MKTESHIEYQRITKTITKTTNFIKPWQNVQIWLGRTLIVLIMFAIGFGGISLVKKS